MQVLHDLVGQASAFIASPDFFYYHGLVLAILWFFVVNVAILMRSLSRTLHGLCFFAIDVTTAFFIIGALIRVWHHIDKFAEWSIIKQGHIMGGNNLMR